MYNNRDRPAKTPYCGFLFATSKLLCLQSFALTTMSFYSDLSPLYDIYFIVIAGFLVTSFSIHEISGKGRILLIKP